MYGKRQPGRILKVADVLLVERGCGPTPKVDGLIIESNSLVWLLAAQYRPICASIFRDFCGTTEFRDIEAAAHSI